MMGRIRNFLKRITGISTPFGGISWSLTPQSHPVANSRAAGAFKLGRLVVPLLIVESIYAGPESEIEVQKIRDYFSLVFGSDLREQDASGILLIKACERAHTHIGLPDVEAAFWIGCLFEVYELSHGEIAQLGSTGGLSILARDKARVLQSLPSYSYVQNAAKILYDHAEKQIALNKPELARVKNVFESYYV